MNIDTDLKQILSYHQSLDDDQFCRQVVDAIHKQQRLRRWIMGSCFLLACAAALWMMALMLPVDSLLLAPGSLSLSVILTVSCLLLWVIFEEFGFIR